jgi:hypothetical protein
MPRRWIELAAEFKGVQHEGHEGNEGSRKMDVSVAGREGDCAKIAIGPRMRIHLPACYSVPLSFMDFSFSLRYLRVLRVDCIFEIHT